MQPPQHIVVGIDLSDASHVVSQTAAFLANQFGARITLASVYDPTPHVTLGTIDLAPKLIDDIETAVLSSLEAVRKNELVDVKDVEVLVLSHRSPGLAIVELCEKVNADLVVVGSHGRTGFRRVLLGSVAEKIVRLAPCSVHVVRAKAE